MEKMICTTPACVTWCIKTLFKRWICSWSYWLSTMITFSFDHARLVCHCCASLGVTFENNNISQGSVATLFSCGEW